MAPTEDPSIKPFTVSIHEADLADLRARILNTRWPTREEVDDASQGMPLDETQSLAKHWASEYDWRRCEAFLNSHPQFTTTIFGLPIHFMHVRSPHASAAPLLITHGWPGSVLEFRYVIEPLANPTAHGGSPADAFHLVIPSLPGYGFSGIPPRDQPSWDMERIAEAWVELMRRLGYSSWMAQGGDMGSLLATRLAGLAPQGLAGVHMNSVFFPTRMILAEQGGKPKNAAEQRALDLADKWEARGDGYFKQMVQSPQTVSYALSDSPVGLLAWMAEKMSVWADPASELTVDDRLDHVTLYWLTNTVASSARLYWRLGQSVRQVQDTQIPVGCSLFPRDALYAPREWGEKFHKKIVYWKEVEEGGHFAAWEVPDIFVRELREWKRAMTDTTAQ